MQHTDLLSDDLSLSPISRNFLSETAKWAKFLAILGFIGCGFMAIFAFIFPVMMNFMPTDDMMGMGMFAGAGFIMTIFYLAFAVLLLMPCLYLYRFSTRTKTALLNSDNATLENSLGNLKSFFKFYGIMTIVLFSFYILIFIVGIAGAAFMR